MLAGLIFATEDAEGRRDTLAATLPFGGMTLIEYQARLMVAAGVSHLIVVVARVTPALLGAVARIGRRGVAVDVVRSAEEAVGKLHPLARVLVFADALVTTDTVALTLASEAPDALLVTAETGGRVAVERVDAAHHWAGVALVSANRVADIAAMPRDYDFQSTLLRVTVQTGAGLLLLPASEVKAGHGVERDPAALAARSNGVLIALANQRIGWADRFVFTPVTRVILPWLVARAVPDWAMVSAGGVFALASIILVALGWMAVGAALAPFAVACWTSGTLLSGLRGSDRLALGQEWAIRAFAALLVLALGVRESLVMGGPLPVALALGLVAVAAIAERVPARRRPWTCDAPFYVLVLAISALAGQVAIGLAVAAAISIATLAALVETIREKP